MTYALAHEGNGPIDPLFDPGMHLGRFGEARALRKARGGAITALFFTTLSCAAAAGGLFYAAHVVWKMGSVGQRIGAFVIGSMGFGVLSSGVTQAAVGGSFVTMATRTGDLEVMGRVKVLSGVGFIALPIGGAIAGAFVVPIFPIVAIAAIGATTSVWVRRCHGE